VHFCDGGWFLRDPAVWNCFRCHGRCLLSHLKLKNAGEEIVVFVFR